MNLCISFSGGETSAFMTQYLLFRQKEWGKVIVVFANTGQENEATLDFVHKCDKLYGFNTVWLEADVQPEVGKKTLHKVVTYETASRDGKPFEDMIKKYGIPNTKFKNCTRELKLRPIQSFIEAINWKKRFYQTAIGIRIDEVDRCSVSAEENYIIYPLVDMKPTTKQDVNEYWEQRSFRLDLKSYEGNCKWCWKKSFRKHYTLIKETPDVYAFPRRMEADYSTVGPEFVKAQRPDYKRVFFRNNRSVDDLFAEAAKLPADFVYASDEAKVFNPDFDVGAGCEESCEVFADEDMNG